MPDDSSPATPEHVSSAAERAAYAAPDPAVEGSAPSPGIAPAPPVPDPAEPPVPVAAGSPPTEGPGFLERMPWWAVPAILVGVPILVALAVQVDPQLYDDFVWKYYWGPIKADAENVSTLVHDGVAAHSGYNLVNTLTWAVLLGVCIVGIAQMLVRFQTPMDDKLIVGATAWVVVGSAAHVLEDAGLFDGWLQYLFITPPIYLLFGAFGIASFLVGQWMKRVAAVGGPHAALRVLWLVHTVLVLVWLGLWLKGWPGIVAYVHPLWVAGFAVVNFLVARHFVLKSGTVDPSQLTLLLSLGTYLLVGAYIVTFIVDPWSRAPGDGMPSSSITAPLLALLAAGFVFLLARKSPKAILGILMVGGAVLGGIVAVAVWNLLVGRLGLPLPSLEGAVAVVAALVVAGAIAYRMWTNLKPRLADITSHVAVAYALAINLLLVFSQMVDAFATAIGIDLAGYSEKHVLSARVIDVTREFGTDMGIAFVAKYPTFLGFAPVKLLVSLLVVYAIDVQSRDDSERHPTLIGLVKFAIIMVGIGPGVRDFTRLSLGV